MKKIIQKRRYTYILSLTLMIVSVGLLLSYGLKLGIDFTGGTLIEVRTSEEGILSRDAVCESLPEDLCSASFIVQPSEDNRTIIRYQESDDTQNALVLTAIENVDPDYELLRTDFIGATVSEQLKGNTVTAILLAISAILIYIAIAFRKISFPVSSWSYGFGAIIALVHDILIVLGVFAYLGYAYGVEIGIPFVAALLTILGYSINDTIVVYDRIRENLLRTKKMEDFEGIVNQSLLETIARSMNTSLTVIVVLIAIIIWGSASLTWFAVALLIGVIAGTYSSIFVATAAIVSIYMYKKKNGLVV